MKKRLIASISQKGGVGKTNYLAALIASLRASGVPCEAFDADGANASLWRALGKGDANPLTGCGKYDLGNADERGMLAISARDAQGGVVLCHDLPGGSLDDLKCVAGESGKRRSADGFLDMLDAVDTRLTVVHMLSPFAETMASVAAVVKEFPLDRCDHVVVLPEWFSSGELDDFPFWVGYRTEAGQVVGGKTRERMLAQGVKEIFAPALRVSVLAKIAANGAAMPFGMALAEIADNREALGLGTLNYAEIGAVSKYCRFFEEETAKAADLLGYGFAKGGDI